MKLSAEQVRHVASLARLSLTPDEVERTRQQLSLILDAMETLAAVDTSGVEPTSHLCDGSAHVRPDEVGPHLSEADVLGNAPKTSGSSFSIPKVLE